MKTDSLDEFLFAPCVAYFSMEMALEPGVPTYSGGLGILAGDTMRSAADLGLPLVGLTLVSRAGYFRQEVDAAGRQTEHPAWWNPAEHATPLPAKVSVEIEGRGVWIAAWLYMVTSPTGGRIPVLLLDTDLPENAEVDRGITHYLYGGDAEYRLKQEIVLGMGGVLMLRALGFKVQRYHLNEGHAALLCLALLRRTRHAARPGQHARALHYNVDEVRSLCVFTTHTPVEAGHDKFPYELVERVLSDQADMKLLKELAGEQHLNMTMLALNLADYVNGVARSHAEQSRQMFPGYIVHAISNGIHPATWTCRSFKQLYTQYFPQWCHEPEALVRIDTVSEELIWQAHMAAKRQLLEFIQRTCGVAMREDIFTLCFARRMTAYKRPDLLFSDIERLRRMASHFPLQIIVAGKAHPQDGEGKRLIEVIHRHLKALEPEIQGVFVPDYSMDAARLLVAGADVWLNTPIPPMEASGTSGMKAAFNGVPSLSVLDGWWLEGCIEGVTGWGIGSANDHAQTHGAALYEKLEQKVAPLYYRDRAGWIRLMKGTIRHLPFLFNSHRMMRRYVTEAYLP